eukprot:8901844-Lingulodinium_polyedra.AAC.1
MVASTAHPGMISRWRAICCGNGQMMATPACRSSLGPCRAHDATFCVNGMIPEVRHANASLSQCVS